MRGKRLPSASFADGLAARGIAALVLVLVILLLVWLHRHDIFPAEEAAASDPALAACIEERTAHVAAMRADGVITAEQAELFRARAIEFCERTVPGE